MVCLLCFECSGDHISLSSVEGDKSKISFVLFKYFRFMFEVILTNSKERLFNTIINNLISKYLPHKKTLYFLVLLRVSPTKELSAENVG